MTPNDSAKKRKMRKIISLRFCFMPVFGLGKVFRFFPVHGVCVLLRAF